MPAPRRARRPLRPRRHAAAPPLDRVEPLNLSRRPFLNSRPVVRVSLLLLAAGPRAPAGQRRRSSRATSRNRPTSAPRSRAASARSPSSGRPATSSRSSLDDFNLEQMNQRVEFLNEQIAERTFSWSLLLDRMAERAAQRRAADPSHAPSWQSDERRRRARSERPRRAQDDRGEEDPAGDHRRGPQRRSAPPIRRQSVRASPFANPNPIHEERVDEAGKLLKFESDRAVRTRRGSRPGRRRSRRCRVIEEHAYARPAPPALPEGAGHEAPRRDLAPAPLDLGAGPALLPGQRGAFAVYTARLRGADRRARRHAEASRSRAQDPGRRAARSSRPCSPACAPTSSRSSSSMPTACPPAAAA